MSADATGWVFTHSPYRHPGFAVHLAIADSVNDQHGYEFWMRHAKLARKARVSRSTVVETIKRMIADGLLLLVDDSPGHVKRYRMLMPRLDVAYDPTATAGAPDDPEPVAPGDNLDAPTCRPGRQVPVGGGDNHLSPPATAIEEPKEEPNGEPKLGDVPRATAHVHRRRHQIPAGFAVSDAMRDWAHANMPTIDVDAETAKFIDYWRGRGEPKADWIATWRNWMRNALRFSTDRRGRIAPPDTSREASSGRLIL